MLKAKDKTAKGTPLKERTLVRHALGSVGGIIAEMTKVYREARDGKLEHDKARSLVWMLSQLRAMIETQALERLEQRLEELSPSLEGKRNGHGAGRSLSGPTLAALEVRK